MSSSSLDQRSQHELVEAIAVWTEDIRDLVTASAGIMDAIMAAGQRPASPIADSVERLTASLHYQSIEVALRDFADDVSHPTCDFVVAALVVAARHQARDLSPLLTHLARCTRAECGMYMRIWVSRARSRTAVRIVLGASMSFFVGTALLSSEYLGPYATLEGSIVASMVVTLFAASAIWMSRISTVALPGRFLTRRLEVVS